MNKSTLFTGIIGVLSLISVSVLWQEQYLLLVVLLGLSICIIIVQQPQKRVTFALLWIFCAIAGSAAEAIAIWSGAWSYEETTLLVPLWLPPLWGIAAIFMTNIYFLINEQLSKKPTQ